jgi:hypothetical protein
MSDASTTATAPRAERRTKRITLASLISRRGATTSREERRSRPVSDVEYRAVLDALHRPAR